jgi:hypothetical protein
MKIAAKMMSGLVKLSLVMTLAVSASVNAAPIINGTLGLTGGNPDIYSELLNFNYVETTDAFSIDGLAQQLTYNSVTDSILNGTFLISGTADGSTATLGLTIEGDLGFGAGTETLLTGSLNSMSYIVGDNTFEFLFGGLGGSLASLFGTEAGVIFTDSGLANFDFTSDLTSLWTGYSDTFGTGVAVSAPSTFSLSLLGLMLLAVARRKRV